MRSRALRLTFCACSCIAIAAVAAFLFYSEKHLASRRVSMRAIDLHAREATEAFADLRAAQRAYVAAGQGVGFWMPKVDATRDAAAAALTALGESATSQVSTTALDDAAAGLTEFGSVDKRVRDYLASGAQLMAADVVFTEGGEAAVGAARAIERTRIEERRALDDLEAAVRRQEALALGGTAAILLLTVFPLAGRPLPRAAVLSPSNDLAPQEARPTPAEEPAPGELGHRASSGAKSGTAPVLGMAAELCTELGRMSDLQELHMLLGRAADVLNASGLVVWVGSPTGAELRPVMAHGYSDEMVARFPQIPRSADNAAAVAYRTGALQIVLSRPGVSKGAVAAPLLSVDGCVGVLSAEIRDGGEASDAVQALATILAAQLSGLLAPATASDEQRVSGSVAL